MGGNALAEFGARRFSKEELNCILPEVLYKLRKYSPVAIPWYSNKESFGDLDLITDPLFYDDYETIICTLDPNRERFICNREQISVYCKGLQVDLIPTREDLKEVALAYYSYNDLGNLMGQVYKRLGLKYGHQGLRLPVHVGTNKILDILLSTDPAEIFEFGGYDYSRFQEGFQDLVDIFKFVETSPYFDPSVFAYSSLNSANRTRNRKRENYHKFLEYLASRVNQGQGAIPDHLDLIFDYFPAAREEYDRGIEEYQDSLLIKEKWNGDIVSGIIGIHGPTLGRFMEFFVQGLEEQGLTLKEMTPEQIEVRIKEVSFVYFMKEEK